MTEAATEAGKQMGPRQSAPTLREPTREDSTAIWELVESSTLDSNSPYSYMMMFAYFADTCVVAEQDGELLGFVTGFRRPDHPERLFVWQIGVSSAARGQGLGTTMLQHLLLRDANRGVRYLEATINPSNTASFGLFRAFADKLGTDCREALAFAADLFPGTDHEEERLVRIGPIALQPRTLPDAADTASSHGEGQWI